MKYGQNGSWKLKPVVCITENSQQNKRKVGIVLLKLYDSTKGRGG